MPSIMFHIDSMHPDVQQTILRSRLLARLERCPTPGVIAITAPSGYGKTTLLRQWSHRTPTLWMTASAATRTSPPLEVMLCERLERDGLLGGTAWRALNLVAQLESIVSALPDGAVIVVDCCERLRAGDEQTLHELAQRLRGTQRLVVAARRWRSFPIAHLVAANRAISIDANELQFDALECEALATQSESGDVFEQAQRTAEGWPVALALAARSPNGPSSIERWIDELLSTLPAPLETALAEAAALDTWSVAEADALSCALPKGWLTKALDAGLPLSELGLGSYRPHALLRQTLETRLSQRPERHTFLHQRAAQRNFEAGQFESALEHYRRISSWEDVWNVLAVWLPKLDDRGEYRRVLEVLEPLPWNAMPQPIGGFAALSCVQCGVFAPLHDQLARTLDDARGRLARSILAARQGDYTAQRRHAERGLELEATSSVRARLLTLYAASFVPDGQLGRAVKVCESALRETEATGDLNAQGVVLYILHCLYGEQRRWAEHDQLLERTLNVYEALEFPPTAAPVLLDRARRSMILGRTTTLRQDLERAQALCANSHTVIEAHWIELLGDLALLERRTPEAIAAYERSIVAFERFGVHRMVPKVRLKIAEAALQRDAPEVAESNWQQARDGIPELPPWLRSGLSFVRGRLELSAGRAQEAMEAFEAVGWTSYDPTHAPRALAHRVALAQRTGRDAHLSARTLRSAVETLTNGVGTALWDEERTLRPMLGVALEVPTAPALTTPRRELAPLERCVPLRVEALGTYRVWVGDQLVTPRLAKARELLLWLVLNGPGTRDQLVTALWDGSREPRHQEYFRTALKRLRAALASSPDVTFQPLSTENGRYALHDDFEVTCDVLQLRTVDETASEAALRLLEGYRGELLPGLVSEWLEHERQRCLHHAVALSVTMASTWESTAPHKAMTLLERALELDPWNDELFETLIALYRRWGEGLRERQYQRRRQGLLNAT
jgi:LuxR family transcriptional regulator, maltose regulon positive regulatory protein